MGFLLLIREGFPYSVRLGQLFWEVRTGATEKRRARHISSTGSEGFLFKMWTGAPAG